MTTITILVVDDENSNPIEGVKVQVWNGVTYVAGGTTDSVGELHLTLAAGSYTVELQKDKVIFTSGSLAVGVSPATTSFEGKLQEFTVPDLAARRCLLWGVTFGPDGIPAKSTVFVETLARDTRAMVPAGGTSTLQLPNTGFVVAIAKEIHSNSDGYWEYTLPWNAMVRVRIPDMNFHQTFRVPEQTKLGIVDVVQYPGPGTFSGEPTPTPPGPPVHSSCCDTVGSISLLELIDTSVLLDGSMTFVKTVLDEFRLETSALTADGISIVDTLNETDRKWIRKNIPHPRWLARTDWHWDFALGDDEATGESGEPLKTHAEYQRRTGWHTYREDQTWTFHSDHPLEDQVSIMAAGFNGQQLKITAVNGVFATGTFSGGIVQHAGNEYWLLHDAGVSDWTPYVGKLIRFTSGAFANNAFAIILEDASDIGAGWVRVAQPYERTTDAFNDQARYSSTGTETYEIQDLVQINNIALNHQPSAIQGPSIPTGLPILFDNLKLPDTAVLGFWDPTFCFARNCEIPNYGQLRHKFYSSNCLFSGDFWVPSPGSISQHQGPVITAGFVFITGEIFFDDFPIFWHCLFGGDLSNATGPSWWHFHGGVALEACTPLDQGIFQAFRWECVIAGIVWGNNNNGDLFHIHPSMRVFVQSFTVTATYSGSFAKIANRTQVPAFDYSTQAFTDLRDTTYTNFQAAVSSGGFGGSMYDPQTLCGIWTTSL